MSGSSILRRGVSPRGVLERGVSERGLRVFERGVPWRALGVGLLLTSMPACAGQAPLTHRYAETTSGYSRSYGAPKGVSFHVDADSARQRVELTVVEQARCDVMRVRSVRRSRETLDGDRVISRVDLGPSQVVEGVEETVPCETRVARDVDVALELGTATYRLGVTDRSGKLGVDLATVFRDSGLGSMAPVPEAGTLIVAGRSAGKLPLAEYQKYSDELGGLLKEFRAIVDQSDEALVSRDIVRAYELYLSLRQRDYGDPRFAALEARFLEHQLQRGVTEAVKAQKRSLQALAEAKKLLALPGVRDAVPAYVILPADGAAPGPDSLRWAVGTILTALRTERPLCGDKSGPFAWERARASDLGPPVRLAFELAHHALGDDFLGRIRHACSRLTKHGLR